MKKLLLLFAVFAICSCSGKFDENAIRDTTNQFFTNIQNQNWTLVNQIYPNFSKITYYHNFINYVIEDMVYEEGTGIQVTVDLEYLTAINSPSSHCKIKLYFDQNKETKTYYIKASQAFAVFARDSYLYKYAVKTGCLNELSDIMDVAISEKLIAANEMYNYYFEKIKEEVTAAISTKKSTKYRYRMFGGDEWFTVYWRINNDSQYNLTGLKYNYTHPIYNGSRVTDSGKVKTLEAGKHVVLEMTGGETNYQSSSFKVVVDDAIHNILQNEITYQGDEYEKYLVEKQNTKTTEEE